MSILDQQISYLRRSIEPVVLAASSGSFGISPAAGKALRDVISHCEDQLDASRVTLDLLQQNTKLGSSPDAKIITTFNSEVAAGGTNSAMSTVNDLRLILAQAKSGIEEAMKHYRQTDADSAEHISRSGE